MHACYAMSRFCVCNDIPLESKEVPIRREKNGVLSYMDLQKDEECHLFRSYFIFDVATKRIPLKGCFYVPDVLLPLETCIWGTQLYYYHSTTGHHATNHFFREKSRKKLGQIAFLLGQYAQKGGTRQFQKGEAIILLFSCFLLTVVVILPGPSKT